MKTQCKLKMRYISNIEVKKEPRVWIDFRVGPQGRWLSELHSQASPPHSAHRCYTSFQSPDSSRVQFHVSDVQLDPVLAGANTDLPISLDLETAKGRMVEP